jgi:hypothetical protein
MKLYGLFKQNWAIESIRPNTARKTGIDIGAGDKSICYSTIESDLYFYASSNWMMLR